MGGPGTPPGKPYQVITLDDDDDKATAQLQAARAAGFEVLFAFEHITNPEPNVEHWATRVILGNYVGKA